MPQNDLQGPWDQQPPVPARTWLSGVRVFVVRGLRLLCNSYFFSGIAEIFYAIMIPVVEFLGYPTCREDCSHGVPEYFTPVASRRLFHSTGKV